MSHATEALQVRGTRRQDALARCERQIAAWGLNMPPVEPLVLDFGLDDFEHVGLIEYWLANEAEAGYCGKYLFLFASQQCPAHSHRVKHETFCVVRGRATVTLDGEPVVLEQGHVLPVGAGQVHTFQGQGNTLLLELSMPCDPSDNVFEDPRIMTWLRRALATQEDTSP